MGWVEHELPEVESHGRGPPAILGNTLVEQNALHVLTADELLRRWIRDVAADG